MFRLCRLRFVGDFLDAIESSATSAMFRQEETTLSLPPARCIDSTLAISAGNHLGGGEKLANVRHVVVPENRAHAEIAADDLFRGIVYVYRCV